MSTMKKPSEYPKANHSSYSEGETLWHRAFFAAIAGESANSREGEASSEEMVKWAGETADEAMAEIERREKGEE